MKVLLIAWSYPPDRLVGGLRAAKVAKTFLAAGHEVHVVTAKLAEREAQRPKAERLRIHPVFSLPNPTAAYGRLKRKLDDRVMRSGEVFGRHISSAEGDRSSRSRWRRTLLSILHLPDKWNGFIIPALLKGLRLVRQMDLVYTTAPPFSDHLVGLALKRIAGIRWVAEFRDPWTENPFSSLESRSRVGEGLNRWLERCCLDSADQVVAVTEGIGELLAKHSTILSTDQIIVARNGIDTLEVGEHPGGGSPPITLLYLGSIYGRRDPRPFLVALSDLRKDYGFGPGEVEVQFVGECETVDGVPLDTIASDLEISDLLSTRAWVPHHEAMDLIHRADILLLLATDQPLQVPNKLYEYLGTGKPIVAFADDKGEVARMLRRVGGHHLVSGDDPRLVRQTLGHALGLGGGDQREKADRAVLREWTTETQMEHLRKSLGL